MADGEEQTAADRAQQPGHAAYEWQTGEAIDQGAGGVTITVRPGSGVESVRVKVPGFDEFESGPEQLREWLHQRGLVRTPQQWTDVDEQIRQAIAASRAGISRPAVYHHGAGSGGYDWEDFAIRRQSMPSRAERDRVNDEQSESWTRMLNGWEQFRRHVEALREAASGDGETIVRNIGDVITALNMIENNDWSPPYTEEFGAWMGLSVDSVTVESLRMAAGTVADAATMLHRQWRHAIDAGNYKGSNLRQAQHEFVAACTRAREALVRS
ncbi:MAG: hypothetical protein ACRD29_13895 [Acidimicrobiales bacterium]